METMVKNHQPTIILRGKRIVLALMEKAYLPFIMKIMNDLRVTRFLTAISPMYFSEEERWIENITENKKNVAFAVLRITEDGDYEYIGHVSVHKCARTNDVAGTGAAFGFDYLNQGYGSEAKHLLLFYAFRFLGIKKIRTSVLSINPRSQKYIERSGHKKIGVFKDEYVRDGKPCDEIFYELFPEYWEPVWEEYKKKYGLEDPF